MTTSDRPAAEGLVAGHYPGSPVEENHTAPSPRRVRGVVCGQTVFDTRRAIYVWEHPYYPQYYIPAADVRADLLVDEGQTTTTSRGQTASRRIVVCDQTRPGAAQFLANSTIEGLDNTYRFTWAALDEWFEEDERIYVHPRSPYARVDAMRANVHVRVAKDGVTLAEADSAIVLFETGLPPRYYLDRSSVHWDNLVASDTRSECPYKGTTSDYWSVVTPTGTHEDLAWGYAFPTKEAQPIAGLVAFYNEKVDIAIEGVALD